VLYMMKRRDLGNEEVVRQITLAEASGDDSRRVHAYFMGAAAFSSDGQYEAANDLVARAHAEAQKTLSPTDLASAAVAEAFTSRDDADALVAFARADDIARTAGNRWMSAFARTEVSGLLVARGELEQGCAGLAEMIALWYRAGEWSQQWHTLSRCVIALDRIGRLELAMELLGSIDTHALLAVAPMSAILQDVVFATRDRMTRDLGDARTDELRSMGAACPIEEIVLRTRRALLGQT
jgi:hypothetical protein